MKRTAAGQEWWYIYGLNGELLAEYLSTQPATPSRHYGYRGGALLVLAEGTAQRWLVTDHLGSTRMEADAGATISRHDYLPYGEELFAGIRSGGAYGYAANNLRQRFGSKERDIETGLDYFGARYYSSTQGRFTSIDQGGPEPADPQSWNRYKYARNNPLYYIDPDGNKDEPAQSQRINQALAADPRLLEVIKASNNFSQRAFEDALLRGDLGGRLNSGSANTLRGLAGEAVVADSLSSFASGLPAGYLTISQPGNLSRFGISAFLPDNVAPDIGVAFTSGTVNLLGVRVEASVTLNNVVADASGKTGSVGLSPDTKFGLIEVKAGFTGKSISEGAGQVARTAEYLKAAGLPGVAILAVDRGAFGKLSDKERAKIYNKINSAGGYIQVFDGLAEQAAKRSRDVIRASQ